MMKDWKATIRLADGSQAKVMIQARNQVEAKKLLQAQYAGCRVIWGPVQGRW
ncbi:MAG TPA: hypothetical protein RMH85_07300 [Polyangiaceae bacterium LLY-WYZ-15_(1-7)]|nr:hypothetical protein [Polyangiaceae bacterium LLY-WYZ-15_(1-7)]HJL00270.1 hypothetical protein [Polyangiaceae bacterium LLY-WYZ-15_(1-7)]HJL08285.1 hypothetical protein [Polyangiaceae bacterium LLY-WYZ-15_(1-7)]HJL22313.1 hypothetical protein [Polyangiaceae bacterium LLY-WYZ-15_(1-7)]HJL31432.1 hypothetical protein [Polyangiaceae bacterium LLY-WYZ-15_(1-7)]